MPFLPVLELSHPVFFFRHGQTDWNAEKRCQGLTDIPLNATGEAQARAYGRTLKAVLRNELDDARQRDRMDEDAHLRPGMREETELDEAIDSASDYILFTSPLCRATRTMELLCETAGIKAQAETDERLIEVDHGAWNGKTYDEIRQEWPEDYAALQQDKWAMRRPDGESYEDRLDAILSFLQEIDRPAIIVGHGGSGRVLRALIARHPPSQVVHLPMTQDQFYGFRNGVETVHRCDDDETS